MKKTRLLDSLMALIYSFRQSTKLLVKGKQEFAANLDPFYILGVFEILRKIKQKSKYLLIILPFLIISVLQILLISHINILKLVVNVAKIIVCFFIMICVKENWKKINVYKITKYATIILTLVTIFSFFFPNTLGLWRMQDYVNKYTTTRLQGFFLEPSELGFHVIILIIFHFYYLFKEKRLSRKIEIFSLLLMNSMTLYLAMPMGAIITGFIAIIYLLYSELFTRFPKKKAHIILTSIAVLGLAIITLVLTDNPIYHRIVDTVSGNDSSNNYRIGVSANVLGHSLIDYRGLGVGFGNINTPHFFAEYKHLGVVVVVVNAFQYFIIEGGIFAILFLIWLWWFIIKETKKNYIPLKGAILLFLFCYQIFGGHFTSGLTWALYGLCMSGYMGETITKKKAKK